MPSASAGIPVMLVSTGAACCARCRCCRLGRQMKMDTSRHMIAANPKTPPTTPPIMAAVDGLLLLGSGVELAVVPAAGALVAELAAEPELETLVGVAMLALKALVRALLAALAAVALLASLALLTALAPLAVMEVTAELALEALELDDVPAQTVLT